MNKVEIAHQRGYRCDKDGSVTSPHREKPLKLQKNCGGYPCFKIVLEDGRYVHVSAHRLQAFQKFGAAMLEPGIEVRHMDDNRANASWGNLELGTRQENEMDKSPETRLRCAIAGARAAQKHDHAAIIQHYHEFGFARTLKDCGVGKGALSFILNKSMAVKQLEAACR